MGVEVSSARARRQKKLQHPTRPVENVVSTTKGLQERKITIEWDDGGKIDNKNKLILTEIFPSMHETRYLKVLMVNNHKSNYICFTTSILIKHTVKIL